MKFSKGLIAASVAVLTALSAGCATSESPAGPGVGAAPPTQPSTSRPVPSDPPYNAGLCPKSATDPAIAKLLAAPDGVALPKDFHAVAVVRCVSVLRGVPGDGTWQYALAQRADTGLTAFLNALRLPSQPQPTGTPYACPAMGLAIPPFGLVDASGAVVRPRLPHSTCGFPLPTVLSALAALPWRTEAEQKVNQVSPPPMNGVDCPPAYKDLFTLYAGDTPLKGSGAHGLSPALPTYTCVYDITPTTGSVPIGKLSNAVRLTASQQSAIAGELDGASRTTAPACASTATRVAVLGGADATGVAVELDGCRRLQFPDGFTDAAPAALLRTLTPLANPVPSPH